MIQALPHAYTLDAEALKLNAYRLLCLFYANKEISRLCDPESSTDAAAVLERRFFWREMTQLLLALAIGLRVLDDQMRARTSVDESRRAYEQRRSKVNDKHHCMMFDDMSLRETCNKIIHATVVQPHSSVGTEHHQIDEWNMLAWSHSIDGFEEGTTPDPVPDPIEWSHLSGHIRLGGRHGDRQWWHLLDVPKFVEAINCLLEEPF